MTPQPAFSGSIATTSTVTSIEAGRGRARDSIRSRISWRLKKRRRVWRPRRRGECAAFAEFIAKTDLRAGHRPDPHTDYITAEETGAAVSSYQPEASCPRSEAARFDQERGPASCSASQPELAHSQRHPSSSSLPAQTSRRRLVRKSMYASSSPVHVNSHKEGAEFRVPLDDRHKPLTFQ